MGATFWNTETLEPKRQFRFLLTISAVGEVGSAATFACRSVTMPNATLDSTSHKFLNHTFKYPNRVVWNPISVVLVDTAQPDMGAEIYKVLQRSGYNVPESAKAAAKNISKAAAARSFGQIIIRHLGAPAPAGGGVPKVISPNANVLSEWTLHNPFINGTIDFGGDLNYENDGLLEVKFDIDYDYAIQTAGGSLRL